MPLNRYLIRNEYNLADPELYRTADKDDPEALLEGVAMAGLVGVLRQLGDLAEFAAEIFHDLHEEVMATAARGHDLIVRVQQLEAEFPSLEKTLLSQTNHSAFLYNPGIDWHSKVHMDESLVTRGDLPRFVMDNYEECRGPPRLFLLDKFDVAGAGACLKRYTDPSFFKLESADSSNNKSEAQREKRTRKVKRRAARCRNGDTPVVIPSSHAKLHQLLLEERIESGGNDPERRVKLKKRPLDRFQCDEKSGKSYMQKYLDTCSMKHKVAQEISLDLVPINVESDITTQSGLEIVEIGTVSSYHEPFEKGKLAYSPHSSPETMEHSSKNQLNEVEDGKSTKISGEINEIDTGKILLLLSKEMKEEEELAMADSARKSEGSIGEFHSDDIVSEADNYVDASATMESDIETDTDSRSKRELHQLNISQRMMNSDGSEGQHETQNRLLDYQSVGNSTISDDGSVLKKEDSFSCSDTVSYIAESASAGDGGMAKSFTSSVELPYQQSLSMAGERNQEHDYVVFDTLESEDKMVDPEMEVASSNSTKFGNAFAKTELKWVTRSDQVSRKDSVSSSPSSTRDELQMRELNLLGRMKSSSCSVSSYSEEPMGDLGLLLVVNGLPVSPPKRSDPSCLDSVDGNHLSSLENLSSLVDLEEKSVKAENNFSVTRDASLDSQLDVSEGVRCCGDESNISSASTAISGEKLEESRVSTLTDGDGKMELGADMAPDGQCTVEITPFVDHTEAQFPTSGAHPHSELQCLEETEAAEKREVESSEVEEEGFDGPTHGLDTGVCGEVIRETTDSPFLVEHHKAGTGASVFPGTEQQPILLAAEEVESTLVVDSFEINTACTSTSPDIPVSPQPKSSGDAHFDDGPVGSIEKEDTHVTLRNNSGGDDVVSSDAISPDSPSTHSRGSHYLLEEDKPLDEDHTTAETVDAEDVIPMARDDGIKDGNVDAVSLSSKLDQISSLYPLEQHEEGSQTCPLKHDAELDVREDASFISKLPLHLGSVSKGDPVLRSPNNASDSFLAEEQDNLCVANGGTASSSSADSSQESNSSQQDYLVYYKEDHMDAIGSHTHTELQVALNEPKEPEQGEATVEHLQAPDQSSLAAANLYVQSNYLDLGSQTLDGGTVTIPPNTGLSQNQPMISEFPGQSMDPSLSSFPSLGAIPGMIQIKLDEMPPPPPLPPMQWRLGKSLQHASSMGLSGCIQNTMVSVQRVAPSQACSNPEPSTQNSVGSQHWNPFSSYSMEDSQADHLGYHLQQPVDLILPNENIVHDQSQENHLIVDQHEDGQLVAGSQHDHQSSDPGVTYTSVGSSVNELFFEASSEHTNASSREEVIQQETSVLIEKLQHISPAEEQEVVTEVLTDHTESSIRGNMIKQEAAIQDEKLESVSPTSVGSSVNEPFVEASSVYTNASSREEMIQQETSVMVEKLQYISPAEEQEGVTEVSAKHTESSIRGEVIEQAAAVQDEKLESVSPAGEQERVILDEQPEQVSSVPEEDTVNNSNQPESLLTMQYDHQLQHGFIAPEDQKSWSINAFARVEPGTENGKLQKKPPRPRNPLIDAVVALDRSKLRKIGEIAKAEDKPKTKEREQNLPQLRKVGERVKPQDAPKADVSNRHLPQLRKVGERVKSRAEVNSKKQEPNLPRLRKVGERVKHQEEAKAEEKEPSVPILRKVGERTNLQDDEPQSEEKEPSLPVLRKVGDRVKPQDESGSGEKEQTLPQLQRVREAVKHQDRPSIEDRDSLMEQIRNKTFNLKPAVTNRTSIQGPETNLKVAAILQKANTIRQAMAGSDEEDSDGWSDN